MLTWRAGNHRRGRGRPSSVALNGLSVTLQSADSRTSHRPFLLSLAEAPDLKQEERLQELESCSGVGSTSDDTEVREVSSRPSTPGLSVVSGTNVGSVSFVSSHFFSV